LPAIRTTQLPPGVPYEQQQFYALMSENGVLDITLAESEQLAAAIRSQLTTPSSE
jgi:histidine triad (HIT) family protein